MSTGASDDEEGDDTPPTRSYVDALLRGNLSVDQVASLRAEIASRAEEESARLARSYPPAAPSSPPSAPGSSPRRPRSHAPPSQGGAPPSIAPMSSPYSYVPSSQGSAPTSSPRTPPAFSQAPASIAPTSSPRTPPAFSQAPASIAPTSSPRTPPAYSPPPVTMGGPERSAHPPPIPPPAVAIAESPEVSISWPSAAGDAALDEDDQRTLARAYRPAPPLADAPAPAAFEPPADIAHPYVFDDDPADGPDEADGSNLTAVHIYSSQEIVDMVDLGDLGDLTGRASPTHDLAPEYDALLVETYLSALGGTAGVPCLAVHPVAVPSLPLGPQAAFVLSRIDGASSVEDVLDMSGLPRVETLRILYELHQQGTIRVESVED